MKQNDLLETRYHNETLPGRAARMVTEIPYLDIWDKMHATITRTDAIVSVVTGNFLDGSPAHNTLEKGAVATLLWQVQENLDKMVLLTDAAFAAQREK